MISKRLGGLCAAFGLALGLGACTDDYGYGGVQVGYGNAGYYGDPYYDGYGYGGYGLSNFGWYGDYYYPGAGVYVYDQYRRPYRWNDNQRRYWGNQQRYRGRDWNGQGSWNGFDRRPNGIGQRNPRFDGDRRWQNNGGNRQWQGGDANRGWRGNDGNRQWQGSRGDRQRDGFRPGGGRGDRATGGGQGGRGDRRGRGTN